MHQHTLESGIDVGQRINVRPGRFVKKNKSRALKKIKPYSIALQTFFNSIPTYCTDDIVKDTGETREDQNSVKKVPITQPFYHSQKMPPHWDGAF
jgi:hypothetical protein